MFFTETVFVVGTLMGITNTVATIPGFVGPAVVKALAHKVRKLNETQQYLIIIATTSF